MMDVKWSGYGVTFCARSVPIEPAAAVNRKVIKVTGYDERGNVIVEYVTMPREPDYFWLGIDAEMPIKCVSSVFPSFTSEAHGQDVKHSLGLTPLQDGKPG
jgi:hypothetical protein